MQVDSLPTELSGKPYLDGIYCPFYHIIKQVQQLLRKNSHVLISGDRQNPHLCTRAANAFPLPQASLGLLIKDKMSHQTETWQTEPSGKLVMMGNMRALLPWVRETDFLLRPSAHLRGTFRITKENFGATWSFSPGN